MIGHTVPASGISYHETHTIEPDGFTSPRFGKFLEIPEDLAPIPADRPTALRAGHPLAMFVTVREVGSEFALGYRVLENAIFFDVESKVVVEWDAERRNDGVYGSGANRRAAR